MKIFSSIFATFIALLALAFALSNRQLTTISLWPLAVEIQAPLCLLTLGTLLFGVLLGAILMWVNAMPHRRKSRRMRKHLAELQGKVSELQQTVIPPSLHRQHEEDSFLLAGPNESPETKRRFWGSR